MIKCKISFRKSAIYTTRKNVKAAANLAYQGVRVGQGGLRWSAVELQVQIHSHL